jgi:hypothetical protein
VFGRQSDFVIFRPPVCASFSVQLQPFESAAGGQCDIYADGSYDRWRTEGRLLAEGRADIAPPLDREDIPAEPSNPGGTVAADECSSAKIARFARTPEWQAGNRRLRL